MISYKELRAQPRLDLAAASPLPSPLTIYLEPTNVCNFRCQMCPESLPDYAERAGYYKMIDPELYAKVINDMVELGGVRSLKLYFEGEPLLNPRLGEMIRLAKQKKAAERIEVTTNGSLLSAKRAAELIDSGLDYLQVSIYSVFAGDHQEITGQGKFSPDVILANVRELIHLREERGVTHPQVHAKLMYDSDEGRRAFEFQYREIADSIAVHSAHNWGGAAQLQYRPGPLVNIDEAPVYERRACPFPFYMLAVMASGAVTVCCVDWNGGLALGNVRTQSLKEIWQGSAMRELRLIHLDGKRDHLLSCRSCDTPATSPDNVDSLTAAEYRRRSQ